MTPLDKLNIESIPAEDLDLLPPVPSSDNLDKYFASLFDGKTDFLGIRTGIEALDRATFGLDGLVVLAATPGKGKSSLALQIAFESCLQFGTPVLFYSMEMPKRAIFTKILSRLTRTKFSDIVLYGRPILDPDYKAPEGEENSRVSMLREKEREFQEGKGKLQRVASRFFIKDTSDENLTPSRMEEEIQIIKSQTGEQKVLVVIDQLQSFPDSPEASPDPKKRIDDLIKAFRHITDTTEATVLVISQKNRSGYKSQGLESLMGSAMIEYTADTVLLLSDPPGEDGKPREDGPRKIKDIPDDFYEAIDLVIPKQRYGAKGKVELDFYPVWGMFKEVRY